MTDEQTTTHIADAEKMVSQAARRPAETFHPSAFIQEELDERGWTRDMLAHRMGAGFGINRLTLDMYFAVGPSQATLLLGEETSEQLGHAFGVSPEFFENLHQAWLKGFSAND